MTYLTFYSAVASFDLDVFKPCIGWVGDRQWKISANLAASCYFLFDERSRRLFEFSIDAADKLMARADYEEVVRRYKVWIAQYSQLHVRPMRKRQN